MEGSGFTIWRWPIAMKHVSRLEHVSEHANDEGEQQADTPCYHDNSVHNWQ